MNNQMPEKEQMFGQLWNAVMSKELDILIKSRHDYVK